MTLNLVLFVIGLLMLYYGADGLVKGSSSLARSLGLSPLVIGLTVVAFGTSAPELFISVVSAVKNKTMIAVGNVIGSNICNIALVLGAAAVLQPIRSHPAVLRRDIPIMLGISIYLLLISWDSTINKFEGATLFGGIIVYTCFNYIVAVKEKRQAAGSQSVTLALDMTATKIAPIPSRSRQILWIAAGTVGVIIGAEILVDAAVAIMDKIGVSEKFVGLTIVAFGTSVPELATSVVAAIRKEMDISIGNLVGSNVFNILSVLGATALIRKIEIPNGFIKSGLLIDYLVMMGISFLPWLMARKTFTVQRKHGLMLLSCYVAYVVYLVLKT